MDDSIFIYLIAFLISILISYLVIKAAAKSAITEAQQDMLSLMVTQNRMLAKLLNEKGVSREEIEEMFTKSKDEFWSSLKAASDYQ